MRSPLLDLAAATLLLSLAITAQAATVTVTFNLNNGTAVSVPDNTFPPAGNCTACTALEQGLNLRSNNNETSTPIVLTASGTQGSDIAQIYAFGSHDCSGTSSNATFFDFQSSGVSVVKDSSFPGYVQSFYLCNVSPV